MAKTKISSTPLRQVYFGEKPILIEKNWKAWLGNPNKLEANLKVWFAENAKVMAENKSLKEQLKDKNQEITNLKNGSDAEKANLANEKTQLQSQINALNISRDAAWKQLTDSREFVKKTYHYLGNYGTNPPLNNLNDLKWLLRKHDKPTTDKDYYTLYELVSNNKQDKQLNSFLAFQQATDLNDLGIKIKDLKKHYDNSFTIVPKQPKIETPQSI